MTFAKNYFLFSKSPFWYCRKIMLSNFYTHPVQAHEAWVCFFSFSPPQSIVFSLCQLNTTNSVGNYERNVTFYVIIWHEWMNTQTPGHSLSWWSRKSTLWWRFDWLKTQHNKAKPDIMAEHESSMFNRHRCIWARLRPWSLIYISPVCKKIFPQRTNKMLEIS